MRKQYVCPFCFEQHDMNDVEFACEQRFACTPEQDNEYSRWAGVKAQLRPHHFRAKAVKGPLAKWWSMPDSAVCDKCNHTSHTRVCPSCHNELPRTIDTDEQIIVALVGTRGSGKSTYIGVLIHEMIKHMFLPFGGTFQLYGDEDQRQYRDRFERSLYIDHTPIPQTQRHVTTGSGRGKDDRPILGMLKMQSGGMMKKMKIQTLVFFDSAGEDWVDQTALNVVANYLEHAAGIIFLIDPLANANVLGRIGDMSKVAGSIGANDTDNDSLQAEVLVRAANCIRVGKGLKENQKIDIPVAVAFSKLDALEENNMLPRGSQITKPSPHVQFRHFDDNDRLAVDGEMRGLLSSWGEADFLAVLDQNFSHTSCFAFSALGRQPENGMIQPPAPRRIEDAMLWILHERGIL
ncbi:hypothetical protein PSRA_1641 [Pseudoscardovia radai]|uniref:Uncharacterized protein n=2 Tax=Pseudoscardovia radai TaxID=987066 RepID=A0A261ERB4_9BIFI|nr:hypothetical protein PSRA_1641 [Pseudoscardovia radai]